MSFPESEASQGSAIQLPRFVPPSIPLLEYAGRRFTEYVEPAVQSDEALETPVAVTHPEIPIASGWTGQLHGIVHQAVVSEDAIPISDGAKALLGVFAIVLLVFSVVELFTAHTYNSLAQFLDSICNGIVASLIVAIVDGKQITDARRNVALFLNLILVVGFLLVILMRLHTPAFTISGGAAVFGAIGMILQLLMAGVLVVTVARKVPAARAAAKLLLLGALSCAILVGAGVFWILHPMNMHVDEFAALGVIAVIGVLLRPSIQRALQN